MWDQIVLKSTVSTILRVLSSNHYPEMVVGALGVHGKSVRLLVEGATRFGDENVMTRYHKMAGLSAGAPMLNMILVIQTRALKSRSLDHGHSG